MMPALAQYAPLIGLLFFFLIFLGILAYVARPSVRKHCESWGRIPLKEDSHG